MLVAWVLVVSFKHRKNRTRSYATRGILPPIKTSSGNHVMMLGSDKKFMLSLVMSRSAFKVLLHSFDSVGGDEGRFSFPPSRQENSPLLPRSSWKYKPFLWLLTCHSQDNG